MCNFLLKWRSFYQSIGSDYLNRIKLRVNWGLGCLASSIFLAAGCAANHVIPVVEAHDLPKCVWPFPVRDYSFLEFFAPHSSALTERGRTIVKQFHGLGVTVMEVQGNVDNSEVTRLDRGLGLRRAKAVAKVLIGLGVPPERVLIKDFAATRPLVPTPPGVAEALNRRVTLVALAAHVDPNVADERQKCFDWLTATYCKQNLDLADSTQCQNALHYLQYRQ
jgi:hypothetical protein